MRTFGWYSLSALITAAMLVTSLSLFSLLLGWKSLFAIIVMWAFLVPAIAYASAKILRKNNQLLKTIFGLVLFFAFMLFMTYKHSDSDYFLVMKYSLFWSLFIVVIYYFYNYMLDRHERGIAS